ncbi:MAG: chorismate synthase [Bacteroidetes bacterium]|nr:chorismate synthase [Bacteroidota bacterium]MBL6943706.1 chorismate synthase [Bacteroidales bacterium]
MAGNIIGKIITLSTFGESHGIAIGGVLDGLPAGLKIDYNLVQQDINRRRPGQSSLVSGRNELDNIEFLSGIFDGYTLGTPIAFIVRNKDFKSEDYNQLKNVYRPSHADYTYEKKYGLRDHRGGGRSSARETVARVIGGSLAKQFLGKLNISIAAYVNRIGSISVDRNYNELDLKNTETSEVRCPDKEGSEQMIAAIKNASNQGDTLGGEITCIIKNTPIGLGEPVFNKLNADLARAIMSINAVKGFEIGSGFNASRMKGSEHNDLFVVDDGKVHTKTNFSGGIQGGLSNGEDIYFKVAFKPVATLMKDQQTIDSKGSPITIEGKGRHDVTVVPRAVPIVEAMAALVIADHLLLNKIARIDRI